MMTGPRSLTWAADYPTPGTALVIKRFLAVVDQGNWSPGFGMYTLRPRSGLICGGLAFYGKPDRDGRVEVGYGLAPSGRGQGLMADAVRAAVHWAFETGRVRRVWAGVDEGNFASIATLERSSFTRCEDNEFGQVYERWK
ncbi:GNAT family N-acetyltransferase [uncultured Friedmanniella sp.]|uniref:GNAT family N-acetyltransferase n=1 Tax=uncultured Friedmanniella sp. TaxID=335381 RepID=UPI0035CA901A